jgi:hypothetical protein
MKISIARAADLIFLPSYKLFSRFHFLSLSQTPIIQMINSYEKNVLLFLLMKQMFSRALCNIFFGVLGEKEKGITNMVASKG